MLVKIGYFPRNVPKFGLSQIVSGAEIMRHLGQKRMIYSTGLGRSKPTSQPAVITIFPDNFNDNYNDDDNDTQSTSFTLREAILLKKV